jgi:hypothetical protein
MNNTFKDNCNDNEELYVETDALKEKFTFKHKKVANGGLYGGKQSTKPWASIHVDINENNLMQNNLKSANPPPGATDQYVGNNRLGNNYTIMENVKWYNPKYGQCMYNIKGL